LAAGVVGYVFWKTGQFVRAQVALDAVTGNGDTPASLAPRNFLIIGSDSRASVSASDANAGAFLGSPVDGARSDSIMVVRIDPRANTMALLSIPRDLYVPLAGSSHVDRINAALASGPQALIDTIRLNLGIPINNYIQVDFKGFQQLVDAVGGVPIWFDTAVRDDNTGLSIAQPGCYTLTGDQALAFSRSRHLYYQDATNRWVYDGTSDFGRMARQQLLVRRALHKVLSLDLTNLKTFNQLLDVAVNSVTIDQTITRGDLVGLAKRFRSISPDTVQTYGLPVKDFTTRAGAAVLLLQAQQARPALNVFRGLDPNAIRERDVTIDLVDATGVRGKRHDVQTALTAAGFPAAVIGPTRRPASTSIRYAPGSEAAADLVARHLTGPAVLVVDHTLPPDTVTLTAGTDFAQILQTARAPSATTTTATPASSGTTAPTAPAPTTPPVPTTIAGFSPGVPPAGVAC
jgi:LCP family protein required for cell wall assembly